MAGNARLTEHGDGSADLCRAGFNCTQAVTQQGSCDSLERVLGLGLPFPGSHQPRSPATATASSPAAPGYQPQLLQVLPGQLCQGFQGCLMASGVMFWGVFCFSLAVQNARAAGHRAQPTLHGNHLGVQGVLGKEWAPSLFQLEVIPCPGSPGPCKEPLSHFLAVSLQVLEAQNCWASGPPLCAGTIRKVQFFSPAPLAELSNAPALKVLQECLCPLLQPPL